MTYSRAFVTAFFTITIYTEMTLTFLAAGNISSNKVIKAAATKPHLNVKDFGAKGNGVNDDTNAIQTAINSAAKGKGGGDILIPAGFYRITKTLLINKTSNLIIKGQGASALTPRLNATNLVWDGPAGGILMKTVGITRCVFKDMSFLGRAKNKKTPGRAGVLYQAHTVTGWGNMLNRMSNVCFYSADTGIQMGEKSSEHNSSDMVFEFITFTSLDCGFRVVHDQGVDYLFNFVFGLGCKKVLEFQRGGNLMVNNAQLTNCGLFLDIQGGGRNAGIYICNNVRSEADDGGKKNRFQILRSYPLWRQALIKFTGFDDCQWACYQNRTEKRELPLFDIGPGSMVVCDSSIFNGKVAELNGNENAHANLIMRECSFSYVTPKNALTANKFGNYKLLNCTNEAMLPYCDRIKWPESRPPEK